MDDKVQLDPVTPTTPVTPSGTVTNYAKWYTRAAASMIDSVIVGVAFSALFFPLSLVGAIALPDPETPSSLLLQLIIQLLGFAGVLSYYGYFLSKDGTTPGLKLLGIKTVKEDGTLLTFWQGVLRTFVFQIISLINIIMILVTEKKQGAHDMAVKTVVVTVEEKQTIGKVITGFCGGCSCLFFIAMIIGIVSGSSMFLKEINKTMPEFNKEINQVEPKKNIQNQMKQNDRETTQRDMMENNYYNMQEESKNQPTSMQETPAGGNAEDISKVIYNSCMSANTNPNVDLSNYCSCAEKESKTTTDVNLIVERCKNQVRMR